jgi:hypothetical protein
MASQDIRLGVGGFVCEKVQKILFFANAFSALLPTTPVKKAVKFLFQGVQIITEGMLLVGRSYSQVRQCSYCYLTMLSVIFI